MDDQKLIAWLTAQMCLDEFPLCLSYFEGAGRGFVASRDIQTGDLLMAIPSEILLSTNTLFSSKSSFQCNDLLAHQLFKSLKPNVILCVGIALEKMCGSNSFWAPYIDILPLEYTISANFTDEQAQLLQNNTRISVSLFPGVFITLTALQ